jgi:1-acyl-sn-glycerol-3-phosphate acyltransferase
VLWGATATLAGWLRNAALFRLSLGTWSRGILFVAGIRVAVTRAPELTDAPCVFVANHQSALDIPILSAACLVSQDVRFMAKEALFKIPFLGWGIAGNGFIPIKRESPRQAANTIRETVAKNSAAYSYVLFAEGTRSADGRMQDFKRGAIAMVLRIQRPLVPVSIIDACRANPKGRWIVRPGTVRVVFHAPVVVPENDGDDRALRETITARVQQAVEGALPEEQRRAAA